METVEPSALIVLGLLLLIGFVAHELGERTHVPRVTLMIVLGIVCGPSGLDLIPESVDELFPQVAYMALAFVGFLLGERFLGRDLKRSTGMVLRISFGETIGAAMAVFLVLIIAGIDLPLALLLAGIAPASAPAATLDIVNEGNSRGPLTDTVLRVVAIDDAWGIILFSVLLVLAEGTLGDARMSTELVAGTWEIAGALLIGIGVGLPMAWLTGRIRPGEPTVLEAAGFVFLCGGLAIVLDASYLLACMTLGATVANRATHHTRPFREIRRIHEPFLAMFFVLAGYELDLSALNATGFTVVLYIFARSAGLILGGKLGAAMSPEAPPVVRKRIGWCLLPQAGVALGMALMVSERAPEFGQFILPLVIATTVV
ncbi:MAG: Kef-type K+ transport system membrane component KefB, partial [Gammaproteobacteria bacterium]